MVELDDGTKLVQTNAILEYLAHEHGFAPKTSMDAYKTQHLLSLFNEDFVARRWYKVFQAKEEDKPAAVENFIKNDLPWFMGHLERKLEGHKFILGDSLSMVDFVIGGLFTNMILNPNNKMATQFADFWANQAGEKCKAYAANFQEEFKEYLASRPQNCTM